MPQFGISSFGRSYVIDEELEELPPIRWAFMAITCILGLGSLIKFLSHLHTITSRRDKTCNYFPLDTSAKRIITMYILSHVIHSIHFVDNIYRPVDYFEPKWLYSRIIISEMEITFFANFPITLCGLIFMERLVSSVSKRNLPQVADACKKMAWYIFGSFLTLGHYRTEPPWNYSLSTTFTIAGEGVCSIVLAIWLVQYYKFISRKLLARGSIDEEGTPSSIDKLSSKTM